MKFADVEKLFEFAPNTQEQDDSIALVYSAARILAKTIVNAVPEQHAKQALAQLAQVVVICRQGIEVEAPAVSNLTVIHHGA